MAGEQAKNLLDIMIKRVFWKFFGKRVCYVPICNNQKSLPKQLGSGGAVSSQLVQARALLGVQGAKPEVPEILPFHRA